LTAFPFPSRLLLGGDRLSSVDSHHVLATSLLVLEGRFTTSPLPAIDLFRFAGIRVHDPGIGVQIAGMAVQIARNERSDSAGIGVHFQSEWVVDGDVNPREVVEERVRASDFVAEF
jgi:hypothetical protein